MSSTPPQYRKPTRCLAALRWRNLALAIAALVSIGLWVTWIDASLARTAHATGYALYAAVLLLAAYQLRKKLPGLPLGTSRAWLRAHLIVAIASGGLFYWHLAGQWPNGLLESILAALYSATFLSGVGGLYLSRTIPRKLARTGQQFIHERIPAIRWRVHSESRAAVLDEVAKSGATTLAGFYTDSLHGFFRKPRSVAFALRPTSATRKRLFRELGGIDRFLTDGERAVAERLFSLIRRKDDLDFHASRQGLLKLWVFLHVGLTWSLLTLGAAHGVLALAFRGGPTP